MIHVITLDTDLLLSLFLSWRSYKLILLRLKEVYGINRGYNILIAWLDALLWSAVRINRLTWLKEQFQRLGVSRRGNYTPDGIILNCIKVNSIVW